MAQSSAAARSWCRAWWRSATTSSAIMISSATASWARSTIAATSHASSTCQPRSSRAMTTPFARPICSFFYNSETGLIAVGQIRQSVITGQSYFEATELGETDGEIHDDRGGPRSGPALQRALGRLSGTAVRADLDRSERARQLPGPIHRPAGGHPGPRHVPGRDTQRAYHALRPKQRHYAVGRLGFNGNFNIRQTGLTSPGYGRIAGVGRYLVFLDYIQFLPPTGKAVIGTILPTGEYRELKSQCRPLQRRRLRARLAAPSGIASPNRAKCDGPWVP